MKSITWLLFAIAFGGNVNYAARAGESEAVIQLGCIRDGSSTGPRFIIDRAAKTFTTPNLGPGGLPLIETPEQLSVRIEHDGVLLLQIIVNRYTLRYQLEGNIGIAVQEKGQCKLLKQQL
jgi:hypothetical protein